MNKNIKAEKRARRHVKIRTRVSGTKDMPRLSVFKSNVYIYAQLIDDTKSVTLAASDSKKIKGKKVEAASKVGEAIAKAALAKGIKKVVFDRGGFKYTGRVRTLADSARKAGLAF
jgi:large subunit ribosomal protein L18